MRTPSDPRLTHLPALDGLRALAVVLVIVYHLDVGVFPGGFLGVDLFFVISGFLITTLLLREHDAEGRIALGAFWVRRFRRLVPLLVVVVAATVAATRWWGVPEQWSAVRGDAVGALAYIANWRFIAAEQSYFDTVLGPSPLLHTWSLGVEEQWYLLWPLVMVGLGALASSRWGRWAVLAMLVAGIATSAALMAAWFDPADPSRVYYGTETRAQHLLVGAALAWLLHVRPNVLELAARRPARPMATLALAALVGVAAVTPDDATWLYRGGLLGISLVAAVVVWAVALPADRSPLGWLASPTLVWLGRRSYGLYLWHWPVIVFVGPGIGLPDSGASLVVARMAVLLVLAEAGHRLVETPARRARPPSLRPVLAWSAAAVATVAGAGAVLAPVGGRELATTTVIRPDAPVAERVAEARSVPEPPVATAVGPPTGDRAAVRSFCNSICCDIHPLNNLRVLLYLKDVLGVSDAQRDGWYAHWIDEGFRAAEATAAAHAGQGPFVFGASVSLADACLVPQIYNARRFDVPLDAYPRLVAVDSHCARLPEFAAAVPSLQPDAA